MALRLSNSLQHPLTLAFFNSVACFALHIVGDASGSREFAERLVQVSARYDFPATKAVGSFMLGAACALEGDMASALEQMEPSYEATFGYGFLGMLPGVIMADALAGAESQQGSAGFGDAAARGIEDAGRRRFRSRAMADTWRARVETIGRRCAASGAPFRNRGTHSRRAGGSGLSIESRNTTFPVACGARPARRSEDRA